MFETGCQRPDADRLAALRAALAACAERTIREGPWRSGAFEHLARAGVLVAETSAGEGLSSAAE